MTVLAEFLGKVIEIISDLPEDKLKYWNNNQGALKEFLSGSVPPETTVNLREFKTWKTIKLGAYKSVEDLSKAHTDGGFQIGDYAAQISKKVTIAETEIEIELVIVSVAELGFYKATRRDAIYDRAKELGLDIVPAEAGLQLRLQYPNQPSGEWLCVAMEPIAGSGGSLRVFSVGHSAGCRWLRTGYGDHGHLWRPGNRWVFARPK